MSVNPLTMGALTSNRKRGNDHFKFPALFSPLFDHSYAHVSKKPRLSNSMNQNTVDFDRPFSAKSVNSRISEYPDSKPRFLREVHAPVRSYRFGFSVSKNKTESSSSFKESKVVRMGNICGTLKSSLEEVKNIAMKTFRYIGKENEKEVIEIDDEKERQGDISEYLSVQEVGVVDFPRSKWKEGNGVLGNSQELKGQMVERNFHSLDSSDVSEASCANVKVDSTENMMHLRLLNQEPDVLGVPVHRKLYDSAKKRNDKLGILGFAIELQEKLFQRLQLFRPQKKVEETNKVPEECFRPLTVEEEAQVVGALSNSNRRRVLVSHKNSNIDITGEILQCLKPGAWLNDEVINLYLDLLKEREKREPQKFLKCHFFNTFFYKKLISGRGGYNFQSVRRWTTQKKLGYSLLECDKIFVPIHKEVHWCLAIINKKDEKFQYLDSLRGVDAKVMKVLAKYFVDEVKDKSGKDIDVNSWEQEYVNDLPEQENLFDCGMFMIKYADFYSRDIGLCFNQDHMPYFRQRTVKEILRLKAE